MPQTALYALFVRTTVLVAMLGIGLAKSSEAQLTVRRTLAIAGDSDAYYLNRVSGAVATSNGSIYVLDAAEATVLRFTASGRFLGRIGSRGQGPGEFQTPRILGVHADSLWIWDMASARISILSRDAFVRSVPVSIAGQGILLYSGGIAVIPPLRFRVGSEADRRTVIWRLGGDDRLDTLITIDRAYRTLKYAVDGNAVVGRQPLDDGPLFATSPDGARFVYVRRDGDANKFEIKVFDERGRTLFSREYGYLPQAVSNRHIDEAVNYLAQGPSNSPTGRAAIRTALYIPDHLPTITTALIGTDGTIWLRRENTGTATAKWTRVSSAGQLEGDIWLPKEFSPTFANQALLLGTSMSDDGVPRIERYAVESRP